MREALPEGSKEELIIMCYDSMMKEYRNNCINKTHPYDGIDGLLNELTSRKIRLAVFSNKAHELTKIDPTTKLEFRSNNWIQC